MTEEIKIPIPGYEHYLINNFGEIYSTRFPDKKLKTKTHTNQYVYVSLFNKDKNKGMLCRVNRLVYKAFNGTIPDKMHVDHINGIKEDNRLQNLQLLTASQNIKKHYTNIEGKKEKNKYKLTDEDKIQMYSDYINGIKSINKIAIERNIPNQYLSGMIKKRTTWKKLYESRTI